MTPSAHRYDAAVARYFDAWNAGDAQARAGRTRTVSARGGREYARRLAGNTW